MSADAIHVFQVREGNEEYWKLIQAARRGERSVIVDGRSHGTIVGTLVPPGMEPVTAEEMAMAELAASVHAAKSRTARQRMIKRVSATSA